MAALYKVPVFSSSPSRGGATRLPPYALAPSPGPIARLNAAISCFRRDLRNASLAARYPARRLTPWPDHGYRVLGDTGKHNGLSRAYRYEITRLEAEGLLNPQSRNVLILGQPRQYRKILAASPAGFENTYRIGLWVTEFETMPPDWDFALGMVNEIWTPSEFSARAFRKSSSLPVTVVPHAVKLPPGEPMDRARFDVPDNAFLGLAIMDLGACPDRKNPLAHVAAWKAAFGDDPSAILLMKVRLSRHKAFVRTALEVALANTSNIRLVEAEFTDAEMTAFQRMADVYLSLHRAEGYGLNIHEMLELGVPVLATGWSGNMEFMTHYPHAYAMPYRSVPYQDPTLFYRGNGLFWAEADVETAAAYLLHMHSKSPRSLNPIGTAA
jgi:glycosyltransferase involved in cell wall biosynthesis